MDNKDQKIDNEAPSQECQGHPTPLFQSCDKSTRTHDKQSVTGVLHDQARTDEEVQVMQGSGLSSQPQCNSCTFSDNEAPHQELQGHPTLLASSSFQFCDKSTRTHDNQIIPGVCHDQARTVEEVQVMQGSGLSSQPQCNSCKASNNEAPHQELQGHPTLLASSSFQSCDKSTRTHDNQIVTGVCQVHDEANTDDEVQAMQGCELSGQPQCNSLGDTLEENGDKYMFPKNVIQYVMVGKLRNFGRVVENIGVLFPGLTRCLIYWSDTSSQLKTVGDIVEAKTGQPAQIWLSYQQPTARFIILTDGCKLDTIPDGVNAVISYGLPKDPTSYCKRLSALKGGGMFIVLLRDWKERHGLLQPWIKIIPQKKWQTLVVNPLIREWHLDYTEALQKLGLPIEAAMLGKLFVAAQKRVSYEFSECRMHLEDIENTLDKTSLHPSFRDALQWQLYEYFRYTEDMKGLYHHGLSILACLRAAYEDTRERILDEMVFAAIFTGCDFGDLLTCQADLGEKRRCQLTTFNTANVKLYTEKIFPAVYFESFPRFKFEVMKLRCLITSCGTYQLPLLQKEVNRDVEFLLMHMFSEHILEGIMDGVDATVTITWIKPRTLVTTQAIEQLRERFATWELRVTSTVAEFERAIEQNLE
ncbi:uncharacterized protein LOC9646260 [Selaginella moellendorffii]|uniref:uncharacterized protein LOC9646260 n=1 Tax=Selaginella moellendorffii TaxID=88036 RepID=UPI000D1CCE5B|nr:uncharacterized protein LOC9646260 [Selaginella moellendorffii]|eukprot:XP_024530749.1 uncharacterized protein LOC9646260 [Selaginella moellendorffii]